MQIYGGRHQANKRFGAVRSTEVQGAWNVLDKLTGRPHGEINVSHEVAMSREEFLNGDDGQAALATSHTAVADMLVIHPLPWTMGERSGVLVVLDADDNVVTLLPTKND